MQPRCLSGYLKMWQTPLDWHVCCTQTGAASWQCGAGGAGRPVPQTASARGRHLSCAHTPATECIGQTQAHRLPPASKHRDIELGKLGAEWLTDSDRSTSSRTLTSAQDALLTFGVDMPTLYLTHLSISLGRKQDAWSSKGKLSCNDEVALQCSPQGK